MMTLKEAIDVIGQYKAADVAKTKRTTVQAWHAKGQAPTWRAREAAAIIRAAERAQAEQGKAAA
jgi:hypothetical protein